MMSNIELAALRKLLHFSVPEAAKIIAQVEEQTWRRWEAGTRTVPADVEQKIMVLINWRNNAINSALSSISDATLAYGEPDRVALVWHKTIDSWMTATDAEPLMFRPQQSAIAAIFATNPNMVVLVQFDGVEYSKWLGKRPDTMSMRSAWAATK